MAGSEENIICVELDVEHPGFVLANKMELQMIPIWLENNLVRHLMQVAIGGLRLRKWIGFVVL